MTKRRISLSDLYKEKMQQVSPARQLIMDIQEVTGRSEIAIRMWLCGRTKPEPLIQRIIAEKLDVDPDFLFPAD